MEYEGQYDVREIGSFQGSARVGLSAASQLGTVAVSDLREVLDRIREATAGALNITDAVNAKADELYGGRIEKASAEAQACPPERPGLVGQLRDSLDQLSDAQSRAFTALSRLTTLA